VAQVLFIVAYATSAVTVAALGVAISRGRHFTPARGTLLALTVVTLMWNGAAAWKALTQPADPTLALALTMPIAATTVSCVRTLVKASSDASWRATPRNLINVTAYPVATIMVALSPALRADLVVEHSDGSFGYGPVFWVHVAVAYVLLLGALADVIGARHRIPFLTKHPTAILVVTFAVPIIININRTIFGIPTGSDLTPVGLTLTVLVLYLIVVRGGFADLVPIARDKVVDHLADAIFVIDARGRLVDSNAKARDLAELDQAGHRATGVPFTTACPHIAQAALSAGEHDVVCRGKALVLDIAITDVTDQGARVLGRVIHARDVTQAVTQRRELTRVHHELVQEATANEVLRSELVDQALRDVGTGLHNRRYVMEALPGMVAQCEKHGVPLSIVMVDLDHFKEINDTWGHTVGDRVLAAAAKAMQSATPPGVIARFGGEEFIVLLPGMTTAEASTRADAMRAACSGVEVPTRQGVITLTASAGVAGSGPGSIDALALIQAADGALYRAKDASRDRTWVAVQDQLPR
jgi:diguanylate cyclase (GGDEF)-like protein